MFHLLAYELTTGGAIAALTDSTALVDSEISQRNNHYILTEDYKLLGAAAIGATVTEGQIYVPTYNSVTSYNIWPINRATTILNPPKLQWMAQYMPPVPQNEEIQLRFTDTASEDVYGLLWIATSDFNLNLPRGIDPVPIFACRFTITQATTLRIWNPLAAITLEQSLRGGTYAVVGGDIVQATGIAWRIVFPRAPMYHNRKLRPGKLMQQALGDQQMLTGHGGPFGLGEWGRFSTFELPQIETLNAATVGSATFSGVLYLVRVSENPNVMY